MEESNAAAAAAAAATRRCNEKYAVVLTPAQRTELLELTRNGKDAGAKKLAHARVLLMADRDHPDGRWTDAQIAAALGLHVNTAADVRKRFALHGLAPALDRKRRATPPTPAKIDGRAEAHLVAICRSPAPAGHARWSLRLLADEMGRRGVVVSVCAETVRKALKKTSCAPG